MGFAQSWIAVSEPIAPHKESKPQTLADMIRSLFTPKQ